MSLLTPFLAKMERAMTAQNTWPYDSIFMFYMAALPARA
jgi:cephalosporin-C deacetylase-like acetyl esterase